MERSTRSDATERAYHRFAPSSHDFEFAAPARPGTTEKFDESDIWGSLQPADQAKQKHQQPPRTAELPRVPAAWPGRKSSKPVDRVGGGATAHGSLPVNIPDWSKILGDEYRGHLPGDWELNDVDDEDMEGAPVVPPHELACQRRAASLSFHGGIGIGRTLKVRDAVWKQTGFQA